MSMRYAVRQSGDVIVIELGGRISLAEALAFDDESKLLLQNLVREQVKQGHKKILLNLSEVTYVDSSGLGELVTCLVTVQHLGGELRICNTRERIADLLCITRLDYVLNFDTDEHASLRAFSGDAQTKISA